MLECTRNGEGVRTIIEFLLEGRAGGIPLQLELCDMHVDVFSRAVLRSLDRVATTPVEMLCEVELVLRPLHDAWKRAAVHRRVLDAASLADMLACFDEAAD